MGNRVFIIDDHEQTASNNIYPPYFVLPPALISCELLFYPYFSHDTIMVHRDLLLQVGGYHLDIFHAENYVLWCRLSRITQLAMLPDVRGVCIEIQRVFHNSLQMHKMKQASKLFVMQYLLS